MPDDIEPQTTTAQAADANPAADEAASRAPVPDELAQARRERDDYYDRLLRQAAEFDNYRKRTERERREMARYAAGDVLEALLPVVDDFERALKVECADKEYVRGMDLICQRLFEALKKLGLEPIAAAGQPFDPNLHHAIEMVQTGEAGDQTVIEEYQRGYNFRGRLLRPSMVKVAVRPKNGEQ